ncbi:hypothetical protein, partial [Streptomyces sp. P17]|uniref:hypothetical protein n=1 Tax=Streptomyces sp. P17 TaxID=3074716 RepID=UPI0028F3ED4C
AANLAIGAVNAMVGATIGGINSLIEQVNKIGSVGEYIGIGAFSIETVNPDNYKFKEMANTAADNLAKAVKGRNKQLEKDLNTDYLGAIGGAITNAANTAADRIRKFSDTLGEDKKKKKKSRGKTDEEKFSDIVNGAERTIASLQAERDSIGLSEEATARLKYETQ